MQDRVPAIHYAVPSLKQGQTKTEQRCESQVHAVGPVTTGVGAYDQALGRQNFRKHAHRKKCGGRIDVGIDIPAIEGLPHSKARIEQREKGDRGNQVADQSDDLKAGPKSQQRRQRKRGQIEPPFQQEQPAGRLERSQSNGIDAETQRQSGDREPQQNQRGVPRLPLGRVPPAFPSRKRIGTRIQHPTPCDDQRQHERMDDEATHHTNFEHRRREQEHRENPQAQAIDQARMSGR